MTETTTQTTTIPADFGAYWDAIDADIMVAAPPVTPVAGSQFLWSQIGDLLWLPLSREPRDVVASVIAEHDELIVAIADEDGERARGLASGHVNAETERLVNYRLRLGES